MSGNQYRAVHPSFVAIHGDEVFDHEFASAADERDHVDRGWFEIVPRPYRVLSDNFTVDGAPVAQGEVVEMAVPMEREAAWIDGGHLERVRRDAKPTVETDDEPAPPPKKAATRRAAKSKE
jgi:hypothetical protein